MTGDSLTGAPGRYEGGLFHPDVKNGRANGSVHVTHEGVHFHSADADAVLPLRDLKLTLGGASDRVIFFTHPGRPDITIHTTDHAIVHDPVLAAYPELVSQMGAMRKKKRTASLILLSIVGALFLAIAGLVVAKDRIVFAIASAVPTEWETKLGDTLLEQVIKPQGALHDPELEKQLAIITAPLVDGIGDSRYPLKFYIIENPTPNAFAIPGGNVVIHSGLLLLADRPEEVAGVLAHEIAHVTQRHGFRGIISSLGLYQLVQIFIGDATGLVAVLASNSSFLMDRKFSRDFEREADAKGWEYLMRANIQPQGMIEFFEKLQIEEKKMTENIPVVGAASTLSIVSTHPATEERLESLRARWADVKTKTGFHTFELNYPAFKILLRTKLHSSPAN